MQSRDRAAMRTVVPFRSKVVEPIKLLCRESREQAIRKAGLNLFGLSADDVYIDLLTDSGTGAMSVGQMSALMMGDESYAGARSFDRLVRSFSELTSIPYLVPCHQGRAAERVLDSVLVKPNTVVPGNTHFDTTKAQIEYAGGRCIDCTIKEASEAQLQYPFKGNVDLQKLEQAIEKYGKDNVAYVLITVTCNSGGGQPVSMQNIREVSDLVKKYGIKVFFDAARFAENAYFIQLREPGYENKPIRDIVKEMFSYVDGCTMSSKKDGIVPMGGFIAVRDQGLYEQLKIPTILFEGFYTYGGMSGMIMEALATGLQDVVQEDYLRYRIEQVTTFGKWLIELGVPIVQPVGGHAVFIDGRGFYPNVPESQFPAQLLCVELYREGGVRTVEVGANLIGRNPDTGENIRPALDLCRLCVPRRVYSKEHFEYVVDVVDTVREQQKQRTKGLAFDEEKGIIRHFTSTFKYVE